MQITVSFDSLDEFLKHVTFDGQDKTVISKAPAPAAIAQEVTVFDKAMEETKALAKEPVAEKPAEPEAEKPAEPAPWDPAKISKSDVRALALKLSKSGKAGALREIFGRFGAQKLSDIKEEDYPALMAAMGEADA